MVLAVLCTQNPQHNHVTRQGLNNLVMRVLVIVHASLITMCVPTSRSCLMHILNDHTSDPYYYG